MRHGLFGAALVVAFAIVEYFWAMDRAAAYFMGFFLLVTMIFVGAAARPWHVHIQIDRDEKSCVVRRRFLLVIPVSTRRYDLADGFLYSGTIEYMAKKRIDSNDGGDFDAAGCILGLIAWPLALLYSASKGGGGTTVSELREGVALCLWDPVSDRSIAILRFEDPTEVRELLEAAHRLLPEHVRLP